LSWTRQLVTLALINLILLLTQTICTRYCCKTMEMSKSGFTSTVDIGIRLLIIWFLTLMTVLIWSTAKS
jgi:hypothetical protein